MSAHDTDSLGELYPFRSHHLALPAGRYHYLDEGPRDAPPILCLHGNPTWSFYWRRIVHAFRRDQRVVVPDHIGCGLSDKPQDWAYTLEAHIDNLERLVLALDLSDITLALHDWGGAIGMGLAARHPDRIARLVITNTAAFPNDRIPWRIRVCRTPGLGAVLVRGLDAFAGLATRMAVQRPLDARVAEAMRMPYDSWANRVAIHGFVRDIPTTPSHPTYATLAAIDASLGALRDRPTCIVWGERDWCFSPHFLELWRERFPEASVQRLADAGHWVLEDAPDEVEHALRTFFAEHPLRPPLAVGHEGEHLA